MVELYNTTIYIYICTCMNYISFSVFFKNGGQFWHSILKKFSPEVLHEVTSVVISDVELTIHTCQYSPLDHSFVSLPQWPFTRVCLTCVDLFEKIMNEIILLTCIKVHLDSAIWLALTTEQISFTAVHWLFFYWVTSWANTSYCDIANDLDPTQKGKTCNLQEKPLCC